MSAEVLKSPLLIRSVASLSSAIRLLMLRPIEKTNSATHNTDTDGAQRDCPALIEAAYASDEQIVKDAYCDVIHRIIGLKSFQSICTHGLQIDFCELTWSRVQDLTSNHVVEGLHSLDVCTEREGELAAQRKILCNGCLIPKFDC